MAASISVFNTSPYTLGLSVNNGAPFQVNAASPPTWTAGTAWSAPNWNNGGASPGNFGPGANSVLVNVPTGQSTNVVITLPDANPASVQIYFSLTQGGGPGSLMWSALYDGVIVNTGS